MKQRRILVAGAGHGGVYAAMCLAREGYDVTVIEKKSREEIGYDWHDCIYRPAFSFLGIEMPQGDIEPYFYTSYTNPRKTVNLVVDEKGIENLGFLDRKKLIGHLIGLAEKEGVKFVFSTAVTGALTDGKRIIGLETDKGDMKAELVIDAAGIDSPVRSSLPEECGIMREMTENRFYTYRAYFNKTSDEMQYPPQKVYFYHNYRPGMDWLITGENFIDVLVGGFSPIDIDDVEKAVASMREDCPYMGNEIIRGGSFTDIPLRRPLVKFVCDGYAAVGDSACMTEPMSGSGINKSLTAGQILAKCVVSIGRGDYSLGNLWKYQYTYMKEVGNSVFGAEILKELMSSLSGRDIDYFFESGLMTEKEIRYGSISFDGPAEMLRKIKAFLPKIGMAPLLVSMLEKNRLKNKVKAKMPEVYSDKAFKEWASLYGKL